MDHKDSKFDFSQSELELVCDKSFFEEKTKVLSKIKGNYSKLEEAINLMDLPSLPLEAKKRGKISQGENYIGAPWLVLDAPAYFSGKDIFAFRHIFLWGLNASSTFHVSGKFLDYLEFDALPNLIKSNMMILTGDNPFIHHFDPSVYKPIGELSTREIRGLKHIRISIFARPDEWLNSFDKTLEFIKDIQSILKKE